MLTMSQSELGLINSLKRSEPTHLMRRPNYEFCELCDSYVNERRLYENVQKRFYKSKEISHQLAKT